MICVTLGNDPHHILRRKTTGTLEHMILIIGGNMLTLGGGLSQQKPKFRLGIMEINAKSYPRMCLLKGAKDQFFIFDICIVIYHNK